MDRDQELLAEYNAQFGDPRRCPSHPHVTTSSPDGMFDAPCGECEAEMENDKPKAGAERVEIESVRTRTGVLCTLAREGAEYVMVSVHTGEHTLLMDETPKARLDAHWEGFLADNGGRPLPTTSVLTARSWKDIRADMKLAMAQARKAAETILGEGKRDDTFARRAQVRSREGEIIGLDGASDRVGDPDILPISKLTHRRVYATVEHLRARGAVEVGIDGGFDIVHDAFDSGSDYEPRVSEWTVTLTFPVAR